MSDNKQVKWKRRGLFTAEMAVLITASGGTSFLTSAAGWSQVNWLGVTFVACMAVIAIFQLLRNKVFHALYAQDKCGQKKVRNTVMWGAFGFCLAYGVVGGMISLISGYDGSYAVFIGAVIAAVLIFVAQWAAPGLKDPELEQVRKEMKYYEKDERYIAIAHKAGYYTLWTALSLLLIFGAALAAFEVHDISVAVWGILAICVAVFVLWIVLFTVYDNDKDEVNKPRGNGLRGSVITFVISLLPVLLMAARWVVTGLNSMGRAFFFVFVFVSLACLGDIVMKKRFARRG